MNRGKTIDELLAWERSLTDEQRQEFLRETWEKIERLRDVSGPEPDDDFWDQLDAWYRERVSSAAANRP